MYVALTAEDYVHAAADLAALLAFIADLEGPAVDEDVAVWEGPRLVVVRRPDGSLLWVRPQYKPAAEAACCACGRPYYDGCACRWTLSSAAPEAA
jgi:hypothetical protein